MGLIDIKNLKKEFVGEVLFDNITFSINRGDKLAIIGNNGVGKTTLLKILLKEITCDGGSINFASTQSIGYLSQVMINSFENTLFQEMLSAFKDVMDLEKQLRTITEELALNPSSKELLDKYGRIENLFLTKGGYDYHYLIDLMISKFGFSKLDYQRQIKTFSGGERNKIAFTKLLLHHPDVLILDEPTNHLDMSTIEWLEEYLRTYDGAIILVSHDRYFIDHVCNCIFEITNHSGEFYRGNYSYYLEEKVLRFEQRLKAYNLQESEIQKLEALIKKFKPKPTKVTLARDREKKLAKIIENKIDKPTGGSKSIYVNLRAKDDRRVRQLTAIDLCYGYEQKSLSNGINLEVFNGDKIGIIGDNGVGKTTLLKTLAGMIEKISGEIIHHRKLKIGYIDQNQIQIHSSLSIFDYFHNFYPMMSHFEIRHHLGSFLFTGDDTEKIVDNLSGGEKVRLSFARLVLSKYDILLLDEPTNHLDIDTKKVLENTLVEYPGTIIFVSHDRYFVDELANSILEIKNNVATFYKGDYQTYLEYTRFGKKNEPLEKISNKEDVEVDTKKDSKAKTVKFNKEKTEGLIMQLEQEIAELRALYEEEDYYTNLVKMKELDNVIDEKESELRAISKLYFENIDK